MKCAKVFLLVILGLILAFSSLIYADVPRMINYQGKITTPAGALIDTTVQMVFKIYDAATDGGVLWTETQPGVVVEKGVFSVLLGSGNPIPDSVFDGNVRYLGVKVGADPEMTPRKAIVSVGYAFTDCDWTIDGNDIYRLNGDVGIGTANPISKLTVQGNILQNNLSGDYLCYMAPTSADAGFVGTFGPNGNYNATLTNLLGYGNNGYVAVKDASENTRAGMYVGSEGSALVFTRGSNGSDNARLTYPVGIPDHGYLSVQDASGTTKAGMYVGSAGTGRVYTDGPNGNVNAQFSYISGYENHGSVAVNDASGNSQAWMGVGSGGYGFWSALGPNGNYNIILTTISGYPDHGAIAVYDASGNAKAGIQVNSSGQGIVWGDQKSFRMANPNQRGTDVCYSSIEGPEAAAYIRGTGHLVNGQAVITFPDHFETVASAQGMTVQITPLSSISKGLAVVEKSLARLVIEELNDGKGTYDFDYLVMAVRKGYEEYQVIRATLQAQPAPVEEVVPIEAQTDDTEAEPAEKETTPR